MLINIVLSPITFIFKNSTAVYCSHSNDGGVGVFGGENPGW